MNGMVRKKIPAGKKGHAIPFSPAEAAPDTTGLTAVIMTRFFRHVSDNHAERRHRLPLSFAAKRPENASGEAVAPRAERQTCCPLFSAFGQGQTRHGSCTPQRNPEGRTTRTAFAPQAAAADVEETPEPEELFHKCTSGRQKARSGIMPVCDSLCACPNFCRSVVQRMSSAENCTPAASSLLI